MSDTVRAALAAVVDGRTLTIDEARAAMGSVMDGEATPAQLAALLVALRMRGETTDELAGFAACDARPRRSGSRRRPARSTWSGRAATAAARSTSRPPRPSSWPRPASRWPSTATGPSPRGRARPTSSTRSGSGSTTTPRARRRRSATLGFAFLFAPSFHPAMRHAGPTRREIGVRTSFNLLGPLTNPAGATRQVLGVGDPRAAPRAGRGRSSVSARSGRFVVHGAGVDELPLDGSGVVLDVTPDGIDAWTVDRTELASLGLTASHERGPGRRRSRGERQPGRGRPRRCTGPASRRRDSSTPRRRSWPRAACPTSRPGWPPRGPRSTTAERPDCWPGSAPNGSQPTRRGRADAERAAAEPSRRRDARRPGSRRATGVTVATRPRPPPGDAVARPGGGVVAEIAARRIADLEPRARGDRPSPSSTRRPPRRRRRATSSNGWPDPASTSSPRSSGASPSAGPIAATDEDLVARARAYEAGGASAISVLCEPHWFGGSIDDLRAVRAAVSLPVLAKEFVVDAAPARRCSGRPAPTLVLLLAVLHPARAIARARGRARSTSGWSRSSRRTTSASSSARSPPGARLIGLNNRDLRTLDVDPERAAPPPRRSSRTTGSSIAESGVREPATVADWRAAGLRCRARRRGPDARRRIRRRRPARSSRPGPLPTDPAVAARRPFVKICGITDAGRVHRRDRRRRRRDRPEPRPGHASRARRSTRPRRWPALVRGRRAGRGRARRIVAVTADADAERARARSSRRSTPTSSSSRPTSRRPVAASLGRPDLEGAPPPATEPTDVAGGRRGDRRSRPRLPRRRRRPAAARHGRRAASGRHRHALRAGARRGRRPRAAGRPRRRALARERRPALLDGPGDRGRRRVRASRPRAIAGQRPRKDPLRVALFVKRARAARVDRPNIASRPTPVDPGLLEADAAGRWGIDRDFGGRYVPETLMAALERARACVRRAPPRPAVLGRVARAARHLLGRPTPIYRADRLAAETLATARALLGGGAEARIACRRRSGSTSSARTWPTPARTRSTTRSARRC